MSILFIVELNRNQLKTNDGHITLSHDYIPQITSLAPKIQG